MVATRNWPQTSPRSASFQRKTPQPCSVAANRPATHPTVMVPTSRSSSDLSKSLSCLRSFENTPSCPLPNQFSASGVLWLEGQIWRNVKVSTYLCDVKQNIQYNTFASIQFQKMATRWEVFIAFEAIILNSLLSVHECTFIRYQINAMSVKTTQQKKRKRRENIDLEVRDTLLDYIECKKRRLKGIWDVHIGNVRFYVCL